MATSARQSTDNARVSLEGPAASNPHSLSRAVHARRAEYTRPQKLRIKIGSWNVAACPGTERDLKGWFGEGKGIERTLAGLEITEGARYDTKMESISDQEGRRNKKESSLPFGDRSVIPGGEEIGLYVLGLQEVVELTSAKEYIGRVYNDPGPTTKWRNAMIEAVPKGYSLVAEQQLSGLLLYVFASPTIAPTISSVSTVSVGTGMLGYLGNKGAVTTRIVLGETTRMVFVNSHLASGSDPSHLERRCWDVSQILERTKFDPISWAGVLDDRYENIGDEDFAFWFGDLNFRLDGLPGEDIRRLLMLHTKGEYDIGAKSRNKINDELAGQDGPIIIHSVESEDDDEDDPSEPRRSSSTFNSMDDDSSTTLPDPDDFIQDPSQDPVSLQATLDSLLPHDQLRHVQKKKKVFHDGWREGPITFLPTYKYDVGSMGMFDSSEKKRSPSWCDRILYRTRRDKMEFDGKSHEEELARVKDAEMHSRGIDRAGEDEDVLFDYDPEEDGDGDEMIGASPTSPTSGYDEYDGLDDALETEAVVTKEGYLDKIRLDVYTSHQRVLSSDHKPLDAVFTLEYDAVVPELKSKIQQEVARELDRAENEGRPGITVVVDNSHENEDSNTNGAASSTSPSEDVEGADFGNIAFQQRKTRTVTIANTSQVSSTFSFVARPNGSSEEEMIAPPWCSVCVGSEVDEDERIARNLQREITLTPGDAINATIEVFVDDIELVRELNSCKKQLEDVLVLRVTDGRDHFIPIRASWQQSCFGRSIDELIRIPEGGVRSLVPRRNSTKGEAPVNRGHEVCWSAPRELFKLTEAIDSLIDRVIADANMIESARLPDDPHGWPFNDKSWIVKDKKAREARRRPVLEALDSDTDLTASFSPEVPALERLEIIAEVTLLFLSSLKDGIVSADLWTKIEQDILTRGPKQLTDNEDIKTWILDVLSTAPNHNICFVFLTTMLSRVAAEIAPVPKHGWRESTKSSLSNVRRSLSLRGRKGTLEKLDPVAEKREATEKAFADAFAPVLFRGGGGGVKEKRVADERKREILEAFLKSGRN